MVYIGGDLHRKKGQIAAIDQEGKLVLNRKVRGSTAAQLIDQLLQIMAATILSEIGDITRFSSPDKLCSWAGLTPKEHSSADNVRRGHISKQGSRWLRWVMVEAAVHAFRDVEFRQLLPPHRPPAGAKIARVAMARRPLTLVYYALRSETGCRSYPISSNPKVEARSMAVMASH